MKRSEVPTPAYVIDEKKLKHNVSILAEVEEKAGSRILLAQKAYSAYATYPLIAPYLSGTTASGLYEARLGAEEMGLENHVFSPAYTKEELKELLGICDHIIFNSMTQMSQHKELCLRQHHASFGLRINPECSTQEGHEIYDPCGPFSRLGVTRANLDRFIEESGKSVDEVLDWLSGLHFHTLCEQGEEELETTFAAVEERFGDILSKPYIKWLNMGGGHHITKEGYNREALCDLIRRVKEKYDVDVYLEPGEAVALDAGYLVTTVMDVVENGMPILILDASAACHMPDVLEMPYTPPLQGARIASGETEGDGGVICRLASRTCLAGDIIGDYRFDTLPKVGVRLVFEDMAIYSMVKNNTFNGMPLPAIYLEHEDGECELVKRFGYEDFKGRLS